MEMPSDTVMVLNRTPLPPAESARWTASRASSAICTVAGSEVGPGGGNTDLRLAEISILETHSAQHTRVRGACLIPSTTSRELARGSTCFFLAAIAVEKPSQSLKLKVLPSRLASQEYYGSGASLDSRTRGSHYDRTGNTRFRDNLRSTLRERAHARTNESV